MANLDGLEQIIVSPKDSAAVYELLKEAYIPREPMCLGLHASYEEVKPLFEALITPTLDSKVSVGLKDKYSGKIVAMMLNMIIDSPDFELFKEGLNSEKAEVYTKLMKELCSSVDVFQGGKFKKSFELLILCVHPNYGNKGIATEMIKMSEDVGRGVGCDIATIQAVNIITDHIAKKLGYQEMARIDLDGRKKENGEALVDIDRMKANGTNYVTYLSKAL